MPESKVEVAASGACRLEAGFRKRSCKQYPKGLDVNLSLETGVLALLGTKESGRSEILRYLIGMGKPDEGRIRLGDDTLFDSLQKTYVPVYRRKIGYLSDKSSLFVGMTVDDNIRMALLAGGHAEMLQRTGGSDDKNALAVQVTNYLHAYHLDGLGGMYPDALSETQKKQAMMARMMAASPKLLVLDNPFDGLDSYAKAELLHDLKQMIAQLNIIAVYGTDDMDEAYAAGDTICAVNDGTTQMLQKKEDFFADPKTAYAAALSGCSNISPVRLLDDRHAVSDLWADIFFRKESAGQTPVAIGVRAHDFKKSKDSIAGAAHAFVMHDLTIEETPHEWAIHFKPNPRGQAEMVWKVSKDEHERSEFENLTHVYVPESRILWLSE